MDDKYDLETSLRLQKGRFKCWKPTDAVTDSVYETNRRLLAAMRDLGDDVRKLPDGALIYKELIRDFERNQQQFLAVAAACPGGKDLEVWLADFCDNYRQPERRDVSEDVRFFVKSLGYKIGLARRTCIWNFPVEGSRDQIDSLCDAVWEKFRSNLEAGDFFVQREFLKYRLPERPDPRPLNFREFL